MLLLGQARPNNLRHPAKERKKVKTRIAQKYGGGEGKGGDGGGFQAHTCLTSGRRLLHSRALMRRARTPVALFYYVVSRRLWESA